MAPSDGDCSGQSSGVNVQLKATVDDQNVLGYGVVNGVEAIAGVIQNDTSAKVPVNIKNGTRVPYVNFFKSNRMMKPQYKLEYRDSGSGTIKIGDELIDSVEQTYGICLLGYVISGKPPASALFDLVKRWGSNVKFHTYDNGWIVFTFPSTEDKERVLNGGTYMVYGYHLFFLKEMPRYFRFRDEDMNSLPMWVQIHGLPLDCWNCNVLSIIASRVGIPIHMDMLTHDRKKNKFARVLIEVDASKPRVDSVDIELRIGVIEVRFVYEQDIKFCEHCQRVGHVKDTCAVLLNNKDKNLKDDGWKNLNNNRRLNRSRSRHAPRNGYRSRSRVVFEKKSEASTSAAPVEDTVGCSNDTDNQKLATNQSPLQGNKSGIGKSSADQQESIVLGASSLADLVTEHAGCPNVLERLGMTSNLSPKRKNKNVIGVSDVDQHKSDNLDHNTNSTSGNKPQEQLKKSDKEGRGNQHLGAGSSVLHMQQHDSRVKLLNNKAQGRRLRLDNDVPLDNAVKEPVQISQGSNDAGINFGSVHQQSSKIMSIGRNEHNGNIVDRSTALTEQGYTIEYQFPVVMDKGKNSVIEEESEEELVGLDEDDVEIEVDLDNNFKVVENKKSKKQKKKEKKKEYKKINQADSQAHGKNEILREFLQDMENNSSGDTEYFLGSNNPKNDRYFGNMKKGRQPKIASVSL